MRPQQCTAHTWNMRVFQLHISQVHAIIASTPPRCAPPNAPPATPWQLLNESPLSRLIWKAWEVRSVPGVIRTAAEASPRGTSADGQGRRSRAKGGAALHVSSASLPRGRLFAGGRDEPASEAGLSEQGLEPVKGQAVFSDEHTEEFVEALPDAADAAGTESGGGGRAGSGARGSWMPEVEPDGGISEAADVAKPHMQTEGSPGEQDSPLVFSKR